MIIMDKFHFNPLLGLYIFIGFVTLNKSKSVTFAIEKRIYVKMRPDSESAGPTLGPAYNIKYRRQTLF